MAPAPKIRLAVRGYTGSALLFHEKIEVEHEAELEPLTKRLLERLPDYPKRMIEIEFLDEPDVNQWFFRFGTDPAGMVIPISVDLRGENLH